MARSLFLGIGSVLWAVMASRLFWSWRFSWFTWGFGGRPSSSNEGAAVRDEFAAGVDVALVVDRGDPPEFEVVRGLCDGIHALRVADEVARHVFHGVVVLGADRVHEVVQ